MLRMPVARRHRCICRPRSDLATGTFYPLFHPPCQIRWCICHAQVVVADAADAVVAVVAVAADTHGAIEFA